MAEIPNDRYITVKRNADGDIVVLVGEKNATTYHGEEIWKIGYVKETFAWMQEQNPEIEEWHIGEFATAGEYAKAGNPDGDEDWAFNTWCGVKKKNSSAAHWVFLTTRTLGGAHKTNICASHCANFVRYIEEFRAAVLGPKINNAKNDNAQGGTGRGTSATGGMSPVTAPAEQFELVQVIREGTSEIMIKRLKTNNK